MMRQKNQIKMMQKRKVKNSSVVETTAAAASAQLVATLAWLSGLQSIEHCFPFPFLSNSLNPTTDNDCPGSGSGEQMVMLLEISLNHFTVWERGYRKGKERNIERRHERGDAEKRGEEKEGKERIERVSSSPQCSLFLSLSEHNVPLT